MAVKDRADKLLHALQFFESRKKAQVAIEKGLVTLTLSGKTKKISKPSETIEWSDGDTCEVATDPEFAFVSRAGAKLQGALDHFNVRAAGKICLDIGVSTGGFSDCLLKSKAGFVVGIDVGTQQLHPSLLKRENFLHFEKVNAKDALPKLILDALQARTGCGAFDLMVADVSFISVLKVLAPQRQFLQPGGQLLALIKPQFEVGPALLSKKGLVAKDEGLRVVEKTVKNMDSLSLKNVKVMEAVITGEDGNQEYFVHATT